MMSPRSRITKEQQRRELLFLKRLENDGHKVNIDKEQKELLENLRASDDETAAKERLDDAMVSDFVGQDISKEDGQEFYKIILGSIEKQDESQKALNAYKHK
jgi:hypothetical protein